jgi:hypothetical protein
MKGNTLLIASFLSFSSLFTLSPTHGQDAIIAWFSSKLAASAELEQSLKHLQAVRVSWTQTTFRSGQIIKGPESVWVQVTSASFEPKSCKFSIRWETNEGSESLVYYLEETVGVNVLRSQESLQRSAQQRGFPELRYTTNPEFYTVRVEGGWKPFDLILRTSDSAEVLASSFRQAARECNSASSAPPAGTTPTLSDTLAFIAEKLDSQGVLGWVNRVAGIEALRSEEVSQVSPDPKSCTTSFHFKETSGGGTEWDIDRRLSLRRIEKIEVMPLDEVYVRRNTRSGTQSVRIATSPPIYALHLTIVDGQWRDVTFGDEELANRVAKAMVHAAELCGAGGDKEPF